MSKHVLLKPGKEKPLRQKHLWIFSGAVAQYPEFDNGAILPVFSADNELLGHAYFNKRCSIAGRMVSFGNTPPLESLKHKLASAVALRKAFFANSNTTAYRLVNGEGDLLPGLTIDYYDNVLVIQLGTLGMDRLRPWLVDTLCELLKPKAILEKSLTPSRKEEGLSPVQRFLYGPQLEEVVAQENGLKFHIPLMEGQKTGFFLDHREMREWIHSLAKGKRVLNAFAYTGAFSIYALSGGAQIATSVEISEKANSITHRNLILNGFPSEKAPCITADVFQFLRENSLNFDLVILDPPAFAKRKQEVIGGCRGYKDINRLAIQKMPPKSLLLTCSCSYFVDEELFQKVVFQAALEANRNVRIIGRHRLGLDHPINIYHPEGDYLKSLLLYVD